MLVFSRLWCGRVGDEVVLEGTDMIAIGYVNWAFFCREGSFLIIFVSVDFGRWILAVR